ncbi:hypothetical protein PU634_05290 [Oceanimonas pelagia]|uniref:Uncharacterized protein n=1 Tax=Oceanimonas pelagia TaxID=3028314 RepID=A0AA50QCZ7_9GAMM|nr:hypothetical protein [Oceanimonas pelagia]WMC11782.1 hypothetical protein PU634_05290 [Oceanimonas pelagia]
MKIVQSCNLSAAAIKTTKIDISAVCTHQINVMARLLCHGISDGIVNHSDIQTALTVIMEKSDAALAAMSEV